MPDNQDDTLVNGLKRILSGTVVLGNKIRFFIWSMPLHFDREVERLVKADQEFVETLSDDIATCIKEHGGQLSGPYGEFARTSSIHEKLTEGTSSPLVQLASDHDQMVSDTQFVVLMLPEAPDEKTAHLMFHSVEAHQEWSESLRMLANKTLNMRN